MRGKLLLAMTIAVTLTGRLNAATKPPKRVIPWDIPALSKPPKIHPATERPAKGMRAFFYEGAEYKGKRVGSLGDLGCFSFYPGKNLGAYGEGGMVVTDNPDYARTMRMLRDWGAEKKYEHVLKGYNYRLEGIQGAVLRVKLKYLEGWTEGRRAAASRYDDLLAGSDFPTPVASPHNRHVYHVYAIRTSNRQELQDWLQSREVQSNIHYPIPVHLMAAHEDLGYKRGQFPHAEAAADEVLSLPMFPELTEAQTSEVADALLSFAERTSAVG